MKFTSSVISVALSLAARRSSAFAPAIVRQSSFSPSTRLNHSLRTLAIGTDRRVPKTPALLDEKAIAAAKLSTTSSSSQTTSAAATSSTITKDEVRALFELWNAALATGDSRIVADRYITAPVLLPTVSDEPRTDYEGVKDYFDAFLLKEPRGRILEGNIHVGEGWASDSGIYEFTMGATGDVVKARYSYNYIQQDGQWKIQHHHSSVMPEEIAMGKPITQDEVRDLFGLWNDALATGDPKKVAGRYAKEGVLLPTVSDVPRTDYAGIEDYFVGFLKMQPQGEILESHVTIGKNTKS